MYAQDDFEPDHTSSPTDTMIQDLQLYGYRPAAGEADAFAAASALERDVVRVDVDKAVVGY